MTERDDGPTGRDRPQGGGRLVLVATPIGNLGDLSPRAVSALAGADVIVCEDTRRTGRLLEHAGVAKRRLIVANEHAEASAAAEVGRLLAAGATVAVVTDAGTPGISDPGARLVRAAIDGGHPVTVVPGPAAAVAAVAQRPAGRPLRDGGLPPRRVTSAERLTAGWRAAHHRPLRGWHPYAEDMADLAPAAARIRRSPPAASDEAHEGVAGRWARRRRAAVATGERAGAGRRRRRFH